MEKKSSTRKILRKSVSPSTRRSTNSNTTSLIRNGSRSPSPVPSSSTSKPSSNSSKISTISYNNNTSPSRSKSTPTRLKKKPRSKTKNLNSSQNSVTSNAPVVSSEVKSSNDSLQLYKSPTKIPSKDSTTGKVETASPMRVKPGTAATAMLEQRRQSLMAEDGVSFTLANARIATISRPQSRNKSIAGFHHGSPFREQVARAVKEHKIFSTSSQWNSAIRNSLVARGWVEKKHQGLLNVKSIIGSHLTRDVDLRGLEEERDDVWCMRVLEKYPSDFIWVVRRDNIEWRAMLKDQLINRFPRANFTTKVGITSCLQGMHWFTEPGLADTFFPRCYRLSIEEEKLGFIDDFRLSACISLLKWISQTYERYGETAVSDKDSDVTVLCIDFAVRQVNNYVRTRRHEDVDWIMPPSFSTQHWETFLHQYYDLVHKKKKLGLTEENQGIWGKYDLAKKALGKLRPYWPQYDIDGIHNIWICKPGARSRGKGIVVLNELEKVLDLINNGHQREANWVAQKYIERPLLIYKTKFDIRQWFIVTDWSPITIWFYKESYIRFCTRPFTLEDFHESVHLCNNAIQTNYPNAEGRDANLPDENMWDSYRFQAFLKTIGKLDSWSKIIYPGMKESIVGVMLASQEQVEPRRNCYELYGADFMLSEDMKPWLIEINSCPCMSNTTSVTSRMCGQCLDDLIKVVVDRKENKNCDTGCFELIYRQNPSNLTVQQFGGVDLFVQGKKLPKDVDWPGIMTKYNSKRVNSPAIRAPPKPLTTMGTGLTFMDLVQKLRLKELSDGSTTPQAQSDAENQASLQASKTVQQDGSTNKNTKSSKTGPMISFKGFPNTRTSLPEPDYNDMNPLYSQISNRAQQYNTTNNSSTFSKEQTAIGIPWQTFSRNVSNSQYQSDGIKSRGLFTDMSLLIRNPNPTAPTMADLLRISVANDEAISKLHYESKNLRNLAKPFTTASSNLAQPISIENKPMPKRKVAVKYTEESGQSRSQKYTPPQLPSQTKGLNGSLKQAIDAIRRTSKKPNKKNRKDGSSSNPGL